MKKKATEYLNNKEVNVTESDVDKMFRMGVISHSAMRDIAIVQEYAEGKKSKSDIAGEYSVDPATVCRAIKRG